MNRSKMDRIRKFKRLTLQEVRAANSAWISERRARRATR